MRAGGHFGWMTGTLVDNRHSWLTSHSSPLPRLQMWCVQCNVAFSWRTGQPVTSGIIHNPHYYEWLRRTRGEVPPNPGDVPCGGLPGAYDTEDVFRRNKGLPGAADNIRVLRNLHRVVRHVAAIDMPRLRMDAHQDARQDGGAANPNTNADLRLQYLLHNIDQAEWKRKLQQREKRRERAFADMQVYEMFIAAATDCFRAMVNGTQTMQQTVDELAHIQKFANDSLEGIGKRFNTRPKRLRE